MKLKNKLKITLDSFSLQELAEKARIELIKTESRITESITGS